MRPKEHDAVAGVKELRAQLVRRPGTAGNGWRAARLDEGVGRVGRAGGELAGDRCRRVSKEVVTGSQAAGRGDTARQRRQVRVDQSVDVGGAFDEAPDGEVG